MSESIDALKVKYKWVDPEKRALEEENEMLRRIIAKQALEIEVKSAIERLYPFQ